MTEIIPERVAIAQQAGADWVGNPKSDDIVAKITSFHPEGLDVVYECAGQQETIDQALKPLKPGGTLLLILLTLNIPLRRLNWSQAIATVWSKP
jgi:threonine dehydrogenase-like Zn-dependent dehydrogenase